MTTSLNVHPRKNGVLPEVSITNWGSYIALVVEIDGNRTTTFMSPSDEQSMDDFISDVRAALSNVEVETKNVVDFV